MPLVRQAHHERESSVRPERFEAPGPACFEIFGSALIQAVDEPERLLHTAVGHQ